MPRIRTIKPEFPQSETMGRLSRDARLLFMQLWTLADDEGRARASSRMLASLLYPYDDDAREQMDGWLEQLEQEQCVRRYVIDGSSYLEITNWLKHQKIDKPTKSRLPPFVEGSREVAKPREASPTDLGPRTSTLDQDQECCAVGKPTRTDLEPKFKEFWKAYPSRGKAANPRKPARELFERIVRKGINPDEIIAGARKGIGTNSDKAGTEFVPQAVKWLRDERWRDTSAASGDEILSDQERDQLFAKLREKPNDRSGERTELREAGVSSREVQGEGREGSAGPPDHRTRNAGMVSLAAVFRESSGLRAGGHETGSDGDGEDDGPRTMAARF